MRITLRNTITLKCHFCDRFEWKKYEVRNVSVTKKRRGNEMNISQIRTAGISGKQSEIATDRHSQLLSKMAVHFGNVMCVESFSAL
jgi:hypothetical protein